MLICSLIVEVLAYEYFATLDVICHQQLNMIVRDLKKLDAEEFLYVTNPWTHVDFVVYHKLDKMPILVIEVDGYAYHKKGSQQHGRDLIKNKVLDKYGIPFMRMLSNGSMEKEQLVTTLYKLFKNNP